MNIGYIVIAVSAVAVMVVGITEWMKGWPLWFDAVKNPEGPPFPSWIPSVLSPVANLAFGQLMAPLLLPGHFILWGIVLGLLGLAMTELCYQLIVQSIQQVLSGLVSQASGVQIQTPPAQTPQIHA